MVGRYAPEQALQKLLEGTGPRLELVDAHTARVVAEGRGSSLPLPQLAQVQTSYRPLPLLKEEPSPEELVVTDSRIRGIGPVGSEVIVLDRAEFAKQGFGTVQQALQTLPQNAALSAAPSR